MTRRRGTCYTFSDGVSVRNKGQNNNQKNHQGDMPMTRSSYTAMALTGLLLALVLSGTGCAKKVATAPAAAPATAEPSPAPAPPSSTPTISLSASPSAIERGQSTTLTWKSGNATGVT